MSIDKVTLQILANHAQAAADSMAFTLFRTAHSTFVKETEDFTTGLTTPDGMTFASPRDLGATWFIGLDYGNAIKLIPDYRPGDICVTNDPYSGFVCTHTPDLHMWKPIFWEGQLVAFAVGHIHNTDVGGAVPASLSRQLTEVHQEGIRIPPAKIYAEGNLNQELLNVMLTNVRMPEQNHGDLKAQIAAMNTGERKVHDMCRKFGLDVFRQGVKDLLDLGEKQARSLIGRIPDGEYFFADYLDEDAPGGLPVRLALNLKIQGDEAVLDFTGSDPQLLSSLNVPTGGAERHILLMVGYTYCLYSIDPTILLNGGITRPARCIIPEGTILNPKFPAAVGMRSMTCGRLQGVTIGAFQAAVPDLLPAGPAGSSAIMNVKTIDNQTGRLLMASIDPITGGAGGWAGTDGADGSGANSSFLKNTPVEINEIEVPIHIRRYGLVPDSGGAGKHRGGLGTLLEFQVFAPNTVVTARNRDRTRFSAWGANGGLPGATSLFWRNRDTDKAVDLGNTDVVALDPDDVILVSACGGGGWGNPWERDPALVLFDVQQGKVSATAAEQDYGVVIRDGAIDKPATSVLRARMAAAEREPAHFNFNASRIEYERTWTDANYAVLGELLGTMPVHWRHFLKRRVFEEVAALPPAALRGDGSEVRKGFAIAAQAFPQLRPYLAAE
ncbi:MAG: hydantoinase B/oxoprolinase family protein [Alphaproteobacteria bacterium]|nr:hydantoinase B/oxoprolinase family protein [Alphaproteobacteria bacterium]